MTAVRETAAGDCMSSDDHLDLETEDNMKALPPEPFERAVVDELNGEGLREKDYDFYLQQHNSLLSELFLNYFLAL